MRRTAHAMYIRLKRAVVKKTDPLSDSILLGLGRNGAVLGVELLLPIHSAGKRSSL
jgi:uncharacterized protein YuzE